MKSYGYIPANIVRIKYVIVTSDPRFDVSVTYLLRTIYLLRSLFAGLYMALS